MNYRTRGLCPTCRTVILRWKHVGQLKWMPKCPSCGIRPKQMIIQADDTPEAVA